MTDKAEGQLSGRTATGETEERGIPLGKVVAQRYRIQSLIARGGMAAVFLADDLLLHRQVALKVLVPPNKADIASFEHRFRREAQALAQLSHPNIVTLHDFGETKESGYFLAMEYIPGPRMTDLMKDGPMEPIRAIRLVQQVVLALRYAHKKGVIHRDLKPSNLLVLQAEDGSETMKVVDFGLVKLAEVDQSLTQPGLVLGSPHCMAPEQVRGQDTDARTDIYAVGILLFRCITGTFPFHGDNATATMLAHLHQATPSFFAAAPGILVPEGLEPIVARCLAKDPADRYPDMQGLMDDLIAVAGAGAQMHSVTLVKPMPPGAIQEPAPSSSWSRWVILGAGLVGLISVLSAGLVYFAWQQSKLPPLAPSQPVTRPLEPVVPSAPETPPAEQPPAEAAVPPATPESPAAQTAPPTPEKPAMSPEKAPDKPAEKPAKAAPEKPAENAGSQTTPGKKEPEKPAEKPPEKKAPEGYMPLPEDF